MRIRIMAVLTAATLTPGIATAAAPVQAATSTAVSTTQPAASALSTPWKGASSLAALCTLWKQYKQCSDLRPGSGFLKWLASYQNPQGKGGTDWTIIGAFDDTTVHAPSGVGMNAKHSVLYTAKQGITHSKLPHLVSGSTWKAR